MLRAISLFQKGGGVLETITGASMELVSLGHGPALGKLEGITALRKPHLHLHWQEQGKALRCLLQSASRHGEAVLAKQNNITCL